MTVNSNCRICKSNNLLPVIDLGKQPLANAFLRADELDNPEQRFPLVVYLCANCNLAQLVHVVSKELLFSDYIYFSSGMPRLSDHFKKYAEDVINKFLKTPGDFVVEMGSNDGILLQFFKEKKFRVLGVDPAKNIAMIAQTRGVPTVADFFSSALAEDIVQKHGKAKAILGNNVVAHINDYDDLCAGVKTLLSPDGVFVFEAPYLADMFENLAFDTIYHEHLSYLSVRPLKYLFAKFGLEIFDVKIVQAQGQSIRVFVGHKGAHSLGSGVEQCADKEIALGLNNPDAYRVLCKKISQTKNDVVNTLKRLKNQQKRLAAYGAPAKGNTVLNYYNIGTDLLDFALDDLPSKQGLYTPGARLPVVARSFALEHAPQYYFLLAWNYLPGILEKEKDFLRGGGAFILPTGNIIRESVLN